MHIHCLQHVPFEGPAAIAVWAANAGHSFSATPLYEQADLPRQDDFDWLVVMGGPMGVYDESAFPWLATEKVFLREAIAAGKTVIGVCLGAQLLADALGGRVYRGREKEIGWFSIELTETARASHLFGFLPSRFEVFHWHGDTFEIPQGAVRLARSEGCDNQAFLYEERVLGLQFHLESTPQSVGAIVANCADELVGGPYIQSAEQMLDGGSDYFQRNNQALFGILKRLSDP